MRLARLLSRTRFMSQIFAREKMDNSWIFRGILAAAVTLVLFAAAGTNAINCYVCHSINGSDPGCETGVGGVNGELPIALLENNCQTTMGSADGNTVIKANACYMLRGEYRDGKTKKLYYMVARRCAAGIQEVPNAHPDCKNYESRDQMPGPNQHILGCTDTCFTDKCNSNKTMDMTARFRYWMTQHIEAERRQHPNSKIRFPSIFAVEENALLQDTPETPSIAASKAAALAALLGPVFIASLLAL